MTEPTPGPRSDPGAPTAKLPPAPRREPVRKPGPFGVIAGSLGLFLAITAGLAFQMRAGADPALGAGEPQQLAAVAPSPQPRKVLIRRVIVTRIVEHRPAAARGGAAPAPAQAAPSTSSSAPAPAAAAPAPAPAAPAPAPLTTRSS